MFRIGTKEHRISPHTGVGTGSKLLCRPAIGWGHGCVAAKGVSEEPLPCGPRMIAQPQLTAVAVAHPRHAYRAARLEVVQEASRPLVEKDEEYHHTDDPGNSIIHHPQHREQQN